jgi:hypothetical protein
MAGQDGDGYDDAQTYFVAQATWGTVEPHDLRIESPDGEAALSVP